MQPKLLISQTIPGYITIAIRVESTRIHRRSQPRDGTTLQFRQTPLIPIRSRLIRDRPVLVLRAQNTVQAVKDVSLADEVALDVESVVLPVRDGWGAIAFGKAQEGSYCAAALVPATGADFRLTIIEEGDFSGFDVEAEPGLAEGEAPVVPD